MKPGLALGLVLLAACGPARRVVVQDDLEFSSHVLEAVDDFEDVTGCTIWTRVVVGGRRRDWRGLFAPPGTVTIQHKPGKVSRGRTATAYVHRRRIYTKRNAPKPVVVIHELLHTLGFKHDATGLMASKAPVVPLDKSWHAAPPSTRKRVLEFCTD
jgi:hypothetical protein